jgi:starch-binding outer membrane protein, SusD/RagB family
MHTQRHLTPRLLPHLPRRAWVTTLAGIVPAALALGCMNLDGPNQNATTLQSVTGAPSVAAVVALAQGLMFGTRTEMPNFIFMEGTLGREGYCLCANEPRFISEFLIGPIDPGSLGADIFLWRNPYKNIRSANILLHAVTVVPGFTDSQRDATRGFAETIQARDFLNVLDARDSSGIPMAVDVDPSGPPAPIKLLPDALDSIAALLDDAQTKLQNGGAAFPFALTTGFTGFNTPATFLQVNRALRARVAIYQKNYATALTALGGSFVSATAPLTLGAYDVFSTNPGDALNGLYDPGATQYFAHPSFVTDAQTRPDGSADLRVAAKVKVVTPHTLEGVTSNLSITVYNSPTAPIPIIRNAELILLRAEANIGLGNNGAAIADINVVRTQDGGLAPLPGSFSGSLLDEVLYEKRYSLFWEGGHRWIDWRRYGKLLELPRDLPTFKIISRFPLPQAECLPRNPVPAGCAPVFGQ